MKTLLKILIVAAIFCGAAAPAYAESWVFQRSYYSHDPVTNVRIGRVPTKGPYYTRPQGAYVNSGYRNLHSTITVGGRTYDHVNVWESWIQTGQQF